jgi:hypothetical protein
MNFPGEDGHSIVQLEIFEVGPNSNAWERYLKEQKNSRSGRGHHPAHLDKMNLFSNFVYLILATDPFNQILGGIRVQKGDRKNLQVADVNGLWVHLEYEETALSWNLFLSALTLCYIKDIDWVVGSLGSTSVTWANQFNGNIDVKSQFQKQSAHRAVLQDILQSFRIGASYSLSRIN